MKKDITIFAPHPDDELIGCFSVIRRRQIKRVVYFYDLTKERKAEAASVANHYGFIADFSGVKFPLKNLTKCLLIPTRDDNHPQHKAINQFAKSIGGVEMGYYSVDLDKRCELLPEKIR